MKVIAAYLLAVLGGNTCPSEKDLKKILASVGAEADDDRIQLLLSQVDGKDITELIAAGREKLASVPAGGGAACCSCCTWWCAVLLHLLLRRRRKKRKWKKKRCQMMTWASVFSIRRSRRIQFMKCCPLFHLLFPLECILGGLLSTYRFCLNLEFSWKTLVSS
ncbi:uncharacterized protein LOC102577788 [Solanum tuberosum]|uniref:60S acidic ribosomal protein P2 n=1 Tax=Solanum tuberosum TaxID=4113 RepID=Q38M67_SOLTU|nr:uncharacterized protein LOC102577788 [Solanum tuberosum]ABA81865.1 unknown [Solanum tuberosum]